MYKHLAQTVEKHVKDLCLFWYFEKKVKVNRNNLIICAKKISIRKLQNFEGRCSSLL